MQSQLEGLLLGLLKPPAQVDTTAQAQSSNENVYYLLTGEALSKFEAGCRVLLQNNFSLIDSLVFRNMHSTIAISSMLGPVQGVQQAEIVFA